MVQGLVLVPLTPAGPVLEQDLTGVVRLRTDHRVVRGLVPALGGKNDSILLPTGSEEGEVLGVGSIPVAILPSCQNMRIITSQLHNMNIVG